MPDGHRTPRFGASAFVAGVLLVLAACGGGGGATPVTVDAAGVEPRAASTVPDPRAASTSTAVAATPAGATVPVAPLVGPRSSARFEPAPAGDPAPTPSQLRIPSVGLRGAVVRPVGVDGNGAMEIPPAREVGWYRFGAVPGAPGSAVLAAHIAYDGRNGAFRRLIDVELGAGVEVQLSDGTVRRFAVTGIRQYRKDELPRDLLFAREGAPRLVLITCGGDFLPTERAYADNIVVFAEPV